MLIWGSDSRKTGLIIPGGVLTGIGLGILASKAPGISPTWARTPFSWLCFALGLVPDHLPDAIFTCTQWWALIPGGHYGPDRRRHPGYEWSLPLAGHSTWFTLLSSS